MRIDQINKPQTHLIGRKISLRTVKILFAVITALIIALTVYISLAVFPEWMWISPAVYGLSIAYSLYLKRSPLLGNITIAVMGAFVPLVLLFFAKDAVAALTNEKVEVLIYIYAFLLFAIIVPRELSLDISDVEGDRADGCRTLPVVIGVKQSRTVVVLLIIVVMLCAVALIWIWPYLTFTFLIVDALLLVYLLLFKKAKTRIELIRAGRFLWFTLIVALVGCTICTLL
jgi:4-hydroxybenzoate polyprenyltransferase